MMNRQACRTDISIQKACRSRRGFTLVELLIVIGLLGALAALMLSDLSMTRTETLDASIVEKELSDIQRVFQRFAADCVPTQDDYKLLTRYGLEILCQYKGDQANTRGWSFDHQWDPAKAKGWRGPYIESEGRRSFDVADRDGDGIADNAGQPLVESTTPEIAVLCTPYVNDEDDHAGDYYRVIPEVEGDKVTQLWVVFPSHSGTLPASAGDPNAYDHKRRLLLNN
jgi:prepilin-type N-terminal cleavage/methylation domain-containing protein